MSFLDTLRQWDEAVACVDKAHLSQALEILVSIEEPNSKIYFNIGCLHLINQELDAAEKVCLSIYHFCPKAGYIKKNWKLCFQHLTIQEKLNTSVLLASFVII